MDEFWEFLQMHTKIKAYGNTLLKITRHLMTAHSLKALSCLTAHPWEMVFHTLPFRHCLSSVSLQTSLSSPQTGALEIPFPTLLEHCWGMEQALCFFKEWATFDGRLAAVQEHTTKRLPAAFSALCARVAAGQNLVSQWCVCNDTTKSSPSGTRETPSNWRSSFEL